MADGRHAEQIVDCDVHNAPVSDDALRAYLPPEWRARRDTAAICPRHGSSTARTSATAVRAASTRARRLARPGRTRGRRRVCPRRRPGVPARAAPRPLRRALRRAQLPHHGVPRAEPRLRGGAVPRGERVAGRGVAREGAAAAGGHRASPTRTPHWPPRRSTGPPPTRASCRCCCSCAPTSRWAAGATGRSSRPPCANGLPVGIHFGGGRGRNPLTGVRLALVLRGGPHGHGAGVPGAGGEPGRRGRVRELPTLRVVLIEGGFGWLPSLMWRMDKHWKRLRRRGAAPDAAAVGVRARALLGHHAADRGAARPAPPRSPCSSNMGGTDRIMFSTDYPHWDFDDPRRALRVKLAARGARRRSSAATPWRSTGCT